MRCDASEVRTGGAESAATSAADGGASFTAGDAPPTSTREIAAATAAAICLAKRLTRSGVEEVDQGRVDRDGDRVVEPQVERLARAERRHEVRPRCGDAFGARLLLDRVLDALGAGRHRVRVDPEVRHRGRAE